MYSSDLASQTAPSLGEKVRDINWGLVLVVTATAGVGFAMLYSAANGSVNPWASRQAVRFGAGLIMALMVAMIDIRFWFRLAYPAYFASMALLVAVEVMGSMGMGAQRWIDVGWL